MNSVSEGSPVSPVFATPEELIDGLCQPKGSDEAWSRRGIYFNGEPFCYSEQGQQRKNAEAFVKGCGWVPSGLLTPDGLKAGIEIAGEMSK